MPEEIQKQDELTNEEQDMVLEAERSELVFAEHLSGQHNQRTHGRGGLGGVIARDFTGEIAGGGMTLQSRTLEQPTKGIPVGQPGKSGVFDEDRFLNDEDYRYEVTVSWVTKHREDIRDGHVGAWRDTDQHKVVFDVVDVFETRTAGIKAGRDRGERAVYDLATGDTIDTGGTGGYGT